MTFSSFIYCLTPPFLLKMWRNVKPQRREDFPRLQMHEHKGDKIVVVANGPSLRKTMELYKNQLQEMECVMLNLSASTALFEELKPSIYVMTDKSIAFTKNLAFAQSIAILVDNIVRKTTWPMTIIMPSIFQKWWAIDKLNKNSNLTLIYDYSEWKLMDEPQLFRALDANDISVPSYTVTSYALYLAIYWNYRDIYLVGADTSLIKDIYVDQTTNQVFTIDTHYYDNNNVYPGMFESKEKGRLRNTDMVTTMKEIYMDFWEYNMLKRYADWKGVNIYNASEYSLIDCFVRKKLK